ncbi:hypothetical protein Pmar_PMAR010460 [Perkinsus marinus ATCC 50983]|uniref:Uncharacterized protein n=1 Tax=Perkinsus marinus (strain ATCC 50983 / TXsc) TaxID=423536 RepID=C5LEC6_PERM5|nr:hypothetical protein Pmar_PMAR010460 [Perkinsus marinus ATCC 50983]EER04908.1 hypothetical protein Pmar_PMAR010460 [Perkinsus marinus ATCC 50983]|eukprot:XP_002773092.1 hypothetical protein Pmar_PMAR010460 [Perkinsus marinus ATCC 50983]
MAVLKQQLGTYRRKRTNALNAIKDLRQRMADEELGNDEGNAETLQSLSHQWQNMNLAVKSLEDLEEHYEHLFVLGTKIERPSRLRPPEVPSEQAQKTSCNASPSIWGGQPVRDSRLRGSYGSADTSYTF